MSISIVNCLISNIYFVFFKEIFSISSSAESVFLVWIWISFFPWPKLFDDWLHIFSLGSLISGLPYLPCDQACLQTQIPVLKTSWSCPPGMMPYYSCVVLFLSLILGSQFWVKRYSNLISLRRAEGLWAPWGPAGPAGGPSGPSGGLWPPPK